MRGTITPKPLLELMDLPKPNLPHAKKIIDLTLDDGGKIPRASVLPQAPRDVCWNFLYLHGSSYSENPYHPVPDIFPSVRLCAGGGGFALRTLGSDLWRRPRGWHRGEG